MGDEIQRNPGKRVKKEPSGELQDETDPAIKEQLSRIVKDHLRKEEETLKTGEKTKDKKNTKKKQKTKSIKKKEEMGQEYLEKEDIKDERKHIMMFFPWSTKSHRGQQIVLLQGLLDKGHTITAIFSGKSGIVHERYTEIIVNTR